MKKVFYGILIFLGVGLLFFYFFQERFIFLNGKKLPKDFAFDFPEPFQEINLISKDGKTINGLHFTLEKPKGVILFFHGNKGNLDRWGSIVPYLLDYGYEVFVIDYRNYGKSEGSFDEAKMYEDAVVSYDHLKQNYTDDQIVVYGRSLEAAFATEVGVQRNPKHVVLEAPFYNLKRATKFFFALSPSFLLKYGFKTNEKIGNVTSPITIFHGDADETTSFDESKELFGLVKSKNKGFVAIPDGTHHNVKDFEVYQKKMQKILK